MTDYTTGHCPNHNKPGGCQLHNLQCGWPSCDRRPVKTAPEPLAQGHAASCLSGKYGDVLRPFVIAMDRELHANAGKGDRPGWLAMRPEIALLEIYYHLSKLQKAVKDDNGPGIQEYAADVANMSMMLLDICGGLGLIEYASPQPAAEGGRVCKWHQQDEGYDTFSTGCGHEYTVNECTDGNVQLPYCPFCAKPLRGIAWAEDDDISLPEAIEPNPPQPSASVGGREPFNAGWMEGHDKGWPSGYQRALFDSAGMPRDFDWKEAKAKALAAYGESALTTAAGGGGESVVTNRDDISSKLTSLANRWRRTADTNFAADSLDKAIEVSMDNTLRDCADELESLLSAASGEKGVG